MAAVEINTGSIDLPNAVSSEIWAKAQEESAVMRASTSFDLPGPGVTVPLVTAEATASWTDESEEITASKPTFSNKKIQAHKLGVLVPFSNEFARDYASLYDHCVEAIPGAIAERFDGTVFGETAPGANFDVLGGASEVGIAGKTYSGLVAADLAVAVGGGLLNGWVTSPQGRGYLLGATDENGRPLMINNITTDGSIPSLLGQPLFLSRNVYRAAIEEDEGPPEVEARDAQLGYAGDWTSARYGVVQNISIKVLDQATVNIGGVQTNLAQRDMFAVRATFHVGFAVKDAGHFVRLTDAVQA